MPNILWALLMVAVFIGAGAYINKANSKRRKRKRG